MNSRDYMSAWVLPEGREYRTAVYERQRAGGTKPLVDNPTVEEIRDALRAHGAMEVLEVGCGWGRLIEPLSQWFFMAGFEVSGEMIALTHQQIRRRIYCTDITVPLIAKWANQFDAVFCRGVMMFIPPEKLKQAMQNMEAMARTKVLVWEWTDICRQMQATYKSGKFEYHAIPVRDE